MNQEATGHYWVDSTLAALAEVVGKLADAEQYKLCQVKLTRHKGLTLIQIYIDLEEGNVSIDQCALFLKAVRDLIDMQPWAPQQYRLEVSSPGVGSPLGELWQFKKNTGRTIRLHSGERQLEGVIAAVRDGGGVIIDMKSESVEFKYTDLRGAKVVIDSPSRLNTKPKPNETRRR